MTISIWWSIESRSAARVMPEQLSDAISKLGFAARLEESPSGWLLVAGRSTPVRGSALDDDCEVLRSLARACRGVDDGYERVHSTFEGPRPTIS